MHMYGKMKFHGDDVEIKEYRIPIACGVSSSVSNHKPKSRGEDNEKRIDNMYRARATIRDIIWANQSKYTKFITLTYAKTCLDVRKVRRDITTFVQAMRRMGYEMRYLYVLEHQKERGTKEGNAGSIHVHMVLFVDTLIDLDDLRKAWPHCPHPDIKNVRKIRNLGAYVCKYITKENFADFGKRCFSCSLGLARPAEERFYIEGFSDHLDRLHLDTFKQNLIVTKRLEKSADYIAPDGAVVFQKTITTEGKLDCSRIDPLILFVIRNGDNIDVF